VLDVSFNHSKRGMLANEREFAWIPLDMSDLPTRHNDGLALRQNHIERILAGWVSVLAGRASARLSAARSPALGGSPTPQTHRCTRSL
jgi:hypothetical protein